MFALPLATRFSKLLFFNKKRVSLSYHPIFSLSPPMENHSQPTPSRNQNVVVLRHGDRLDNVDDKWLGQAARPWDPPLHETGVARAIRTGRTLRTDAGFPIHRILVSPFLRCVQTAVGAISGLSANAETDPETEPSRIKVSIEFGLCEMLNNIAIRPKVAPNNWELGFNVAELEALFPFGSVDYSAEPVYKELPKRPEEVGEARSRYANIFKALADNYRNENLLLVTHGEGVGVAVTEFMKEKTVEAYDSEYCAYVVLERPVFDGEESCPCSGEFKVQTHQGVMLINLSE